jgi:hypothetical protein
MSSSWASGSLAVLLSNSFVICPYSLVVPTSSAAHCRCRPRRHPARPASSCLTTTTRLFKQHPLEASTSSTPSTASLNSSAACPFKIDWEREEFGQARGLSPRRPPAGRLSFSIWLSARGQGLGAGLGTLPAAHDGCGAPGGEVWWVVCGVPRKVPRGSLDPIFPFFYVCDGANHLSHA